MTKRYIFTFIIIFGFLVDIFGSERKSIPEKLEYPTVTEKEPNTKHKIITCNGMLFLEAEVTVDDGTVFPFMFLIDTGCASSCIIMEEFSPLFDYFNIQIGGTRFLFCKAVFDDFSVENFYLYNFRNAPANLKELKLIFSNKKYFFGILGNDVLMNKSLLLSIANGYFKWTDENPFIDNDSTICPKLDRICSTRSGNDFYQYSIYIEDSHFKSNTLDNPIFGFFNSPDKSKSRYLIDTGTYYIATSNIDLYYQVKNRKLKTYSYNSEISQKLGYANISNPVFLEKQFDSLQVMSGGTPDMYKCLGNQILAAFDIFFDKEKTNKVQEIYFSSVDNSIYKNYRIKNDRSYYYPVTTFGFRTSGQDGRVTEKAFVNGKEILKAIEIGDTILIINGIPYEQIKEWELPDKVKIEVKKKNGKTVKINAKRHYLK